MKKNLKTLALIALLAPVVAVVTPGCAGSATRQSTGQYIDDATITTKVKAAFASDDVVRARDVQVETFKGRVQLSGFVDNSEQKDRAERIARTVNGVQDVTNNITIK